MDNDEKVIETVYCLFLHKQVKVYKRTKARSIFLVNLD